MFDTLSIISLKLDQEGNMNITARGVGEVNQMRKEEKIPKMDNGKRR